MCKDEVWTSCRSWYVLHLQSFATLESSLLKNLSRQHLGLGKSYPNEGFERKDLLVSLLIPKASRKYCQSHFLLTPQLFKLLFLFLKESKCSFKHSSNTPLNFSLSISYQWQFKINQLFEQCRHLVGPSILKFSQWKNAPSLVWQLIS